MYKLYPYYTNDGTIGLFSPKADDIYHSTFGALTEAYEKFILPSNIKDFLKNNNEIKILDICFGIGYNTKSFLNNLLEIIYNDTIYTNNINRQINNDEIYTNNQKLKVFIHAIDNDKNLINLSPFFKRFEKNIGKLNSKNKIIYEQEKIRKLSSNIAKPKFQLKEEVNILLLLQLLKYIDEETLAILNDKNYAVYFDKNNIALYSFLAKERGIISPRMNKTSFLHNIYYKYLSKGYKKALNALELIDFNFERDVNDARVAIKNDLNKYNFIFLDAFTPTKCPCLWTVDFFKLLYEHLDENGMILTYSNSALVRNSFLNAGFDVKKIFSKSQNKFTGTIAFKHTSQKVGFNNDLIYDLSEYDLGLMKTRAGIFYRDENLTLDNEAIISNHKIEVENSPLISSSKFIKSYKKKQN